MPLEMQGQDDDDAGTGIKRFGPPPNPWWRPSGKVGRTILGIAALTALTGLGISIHLFKNFLEHDARFRIAGSGNIEATGLAEVTRSQMLPAFGADIGRNIFFVPLAERRDELEKIPWVEQATVMRLLPDTIKVNIVERQPVAFVRHGQHIGLVDANGVLLDMPASVMAERHYSFPVLTGIDGRDPLTSRKTRVALYLRLMHDLDADGKHYSNQISEIDLTDPEDARVLMPEQGSDILAHFGQDHFLQRFQRYQAHIAEWRQQYPRLAEVDLRYERQVVLQMAPGAATDQTAVNASDGKPSAGKPIAKSAPEAKEHKAAAREEKVARATAPAVKHGEAGTAREASARHSTAKNVRTAKPAKRETVEQAAARMRAERRKREEARRAALRNQKRLTARSHTSATAGHGE